MHALLADLVVYVHLLYVLFAVGGEVLVLLGWLLERRGPLPPALRFTRSPAFRIAHLAAVVLVALEAVAGVLCPLTGWEYELRRLSGQQVESEIPFMSRLVRRVIFYDFPAWVFTLAYVLFALLVAASAVLYPPRKHSRGSAASGRRGFPATGGAAAQSPKGRWRQWNRCNRQHNGPAGDRRAVLEGPHDTSGGDAEGRHAGADPSPSPRRPR